MCSSAQPVDTTIRVNNVGTGKLSLDSAVFTGVDSSFFTVLSLLPDTIQPGASKEMRIRYTPLRSAAAQSKLRLFTNAQNVSNGVIELDIQATRDTTALNFDQSIVQMLNLKPFSSFDTTCTLSNQGTVPVYVPTPLTLDRFIVRGVTPNPIPPGVTARVLLTFANGDTARTYDTLYTVRDSCGRLDSIRLRAVTQSPSATMDLLSSLDVRTNPCLPDFDTTIIVTNV
jgi:hypothetical protein